MKRFFTRLLVGLAAGSALAGRPALADDDGDLENYPAYVEGDEQAPEPLQAQDQLNLETFRDQLAPYGAWDDDPSYGPIFYPAVQAGWRPYVYGQWAWTQYGWTWVSSEPFGWAVFHYGRWWWNPMRHAWAWVPGYEWAPAWVVWRYGEAAIGWAPLYAGYDAWFDGYPVIYSHWVFVPCGHFYGGPVYGWAYGPAYVRSYFSSTVVVVGYAGRVSYGPPRAFVATHSATPIDTAPVVHAASPAQVIAGRGYRGGSVAIYRPSFTAGSPAMRAPGARPPPPMASPYRSAPSFRGPSRVGPMAPPARRAPPPVFVPSRPAPSRAAPAPSGWMQPPAPHAQRSWPPAPTYHPNGRRAPVSLPPAARSAHPAPHGRR